MVFQHEPLRHNFTNSTRVTTAWWSPDDPTRGDSAGDILVEFIDGIQWRYRNCRPKDWSAFVNTVSPGRFIAEELDHHPNGPA